MELFSNKTLFELTLKELVYRYSARLLIILSFTSLPIVYLYAGRDGIIAFVALQMYLIAVYFVIKWQFKRYLVGGRKPKTKDRIFIMITATVSPVVFVPLAVSIIPGFLIASLAYPIDFFKLLYLKSFHKDN